MATAYDTFIELLENPEFVEELKKLIIEDNKNKSLKEDTVKTSDGKWTNKGKEGTQRE